MKTVKVLGGGCANCKATYKMIEEVSQEKGVPVELLKIEDFQEIMTYDIMSTPGVVIDETVVHRGGVPKRTTVESWFTD